MSGTGKMWRRNWQVNPLVESRFKLHLKLSNSGQLMLRGCGIINTEIGSMALAVAWRNPNPGAHNGVITSVLEVLCDGHFTHPPDHARDGSRAVG
jgi:hypothetical protein